MCDALFIWNKQVLCCRINLFQDFIDPRLQGFVIGVALRQ